MFLNYLPLLKEIGFSDLLDIAFSACIVWLGFTVLQSRRTWKIGVGLTIYGLILLLANELEFKLTVWIMQGLIAVVILVIVVIYQIEIRRVLEEIWYMFFTPRQTRLPAQRSVPELLVSTAYELSTLRWGALIVLPGQIALADLISAGTRLDGVISRQLLISLFDPDSPGHDGALVVQRDRVELFGCRLPLTEHDEQLQGRGTRHAAAIGLSEKCDALVLVVSEESGMISVARDGELKKITDSQALLEALTVFRENLAISENSKKSRIPFYRMVFRFAVSVVITSVFWLVLVPGAAVDTTVFEVPIEVQNIPHGFKFESVTPPKASVSLTGERRELFKVGPDDLLISLDGTLTALGRQTYSLNSSQMMVPANLEVEKISPASVKVRVNEVPVE
jgi:uncharacterized protein (TIGR00159 family)